MAVTGETAAKTVTWESDVISGINIYGSSESFTNSGITVTKNGSNALEWNGKQINFWNNDSFTFTSSEGNISSIVITATNSGQGNPNFSPSTGWTKTSSGLLWSGKRYAVGTRG